MLLIRCHYSSRKKRKCDINALICILQQLEITALDSEAIPYTLVTNIVNSTARHIKDGQQITTSRCRGNFCSKLTCKDRECNYHNVLGSKEAEEKHNLEIDSINSRNEIPSLKKINNCEEENNAIVKNANEINLDAIDMETQAFRENQTSMHNTLCNKMKVKRLLHHNKDLGEKVQESKDINKVNHAIDNQYYKLSQSSNIKLDKSNKHAMEWNSDECSLDLEDKCLKKYALMMIWTEKIRL